MSRPPLGLLMSLSLLASGCVSLIAPTSGVPGFVNQQSIATTNSAPSSQDQVLPSTIPQFITPDSPGQGQPPAVYNVDAEVPQQIQPTHQNSLPENLEKKGIFPQQIDLGKPQRFPTTSNGPVTVEKRATPDSAKRPEHAANTPEQSVRKFWETSLFSAAQRPIQISQAGRGSFRILVLGSIYGNDPESIELMDAVLREAPALAQSPSYSFVFVRTPNPDGLVEHIRTNHHGVDLNRNFPSTWFTATPNRLTGPHPASEVETQNLMKMLREFQPHRVLHLRSSIGQRPLVLLNEQLEHAVQDIRQQQKVDVGTFSGEYKAGSLEEFVSLRINTELMTILLPPKGFPQISTAELVRLATTNFDKKSPQVPDESVARSVPVSPQIQVSEPLRSILQPDGEKGYVELLPPPPNGESFNRASQTSTPGTAEYYELPPPPSAEPGSR